MCAYSVMSTNPAYIAAGHDIRFQCTIHASTSPTPTHQKSGVAYVAFFFFFFFFFESPKYQEAWADCSKGGERQPKRREETIATISNCFPSSEIFPQFWWSGPASAMQRPGSWNSNVGGTSAEGHWQAQDIRAVRLALENVRKKRLWGKLPSKQFSKGRKQRFRNSSR